ncbi:MAG: proprotein convertase P-domain-containing protein, partial [Acidobacteriota bacterium]
MCTSNRAGAALLALLLSAFVPRPSVADAWPWAGAVQGQKDNAPSATVEAERGALTFFPDRVSFDAAFPGLPVEDFEAGAVALVDVVACAAPLDAGGDGTCFGAGDLLDGIVFQDTPGPDSDGLLLVGDLALGNSSKVLATNSLGDAHEIVFPEPVEAVALDLFNFPGAADAVTVEIFGPGDALLGMTSTPSSATGEFFGVSSPDPIARLVITSTINQSEGIDNVAFGIVPAIVFDGFTTDDLCALEPANENGIWEPGEILELTVNLRASGGDFTGISGSLSSADPSVVVLAADSPWPDLARGSAGSNGAPLRLVIDGDLCNQVVELTLDVSSDQGSFQIPFGERVGADQMPADLPLPVPDAGAPAASTLTIATEAVVSNLQVEVDVEHTWVGDLTISLESPDGTTVVLLDRPGVPASVQGCDNNDVRVTFSDGAATDPENVCNAASSDPWVTGEVQPVQALAAFDGEDTDGPWILRVTDSLAGDLGTLIDWRLVNDAPIGEACVACGSQSDLAIAKSCFTSPVVGCTLEVTNLGVSAALDVEVTDTLPPLLTWVADDCGAGPPVGQVLTWNLGSLDVGSTAICNL